MFSPYCFLIRPVVLRWFAVFILLLGGWAGVAGEPLGPSSRRTGLVISEIMFHPAPRSDGKKLEYIELFNSQVTTENLSGYRLTSAIDFTFPQGTLLRPGQFLVVAKSASDLQTVSGATNIIGNYDGSLEAVSGTIRLRHRTGAIYLEANYGTEQPWSAAADGVGHSLVLAYPSYGERNAAAWAASARIGGSPGTAEPTEASPYAGLVINELFATHRPGEVPFVELYNGGTAVMNLAGCVLTDDAAVAKFTLPAGTTLPAGGWISFTASQLGFTNSPLGGTIHLFEPGRSRVVDAVKYGPQASGISSGRYANGAGVWGELEQATPGASNRRWRARDIVINEIMYHPISNTNDDEYLELFNRSSVPTDLSGWKMLGGIDFTFPANTTIPAQGYIVVARNAARLMSNHPTLSAANTVGDFAGSLSNSGERIALAKPEWIMMRNPDGQITSNLTHVVVCDVTYGTGGRWGKWSDGGGSSLELIDPRADVRLAANWADSDETKKAPWTSIEYTGRLDNGSGDINQLQMFLQDAGECLVDNVQVVSGGRSLISNSTFESNANGWTAEGTQVRSGLETTEGYQSQQSFHIRAIGRGDNQVNRIRSRLSSTLSAGGTATIRAQVRWLCGSPTMLFRLRGNYLEAIGTMNIPANLGTPGARNSRAVTNAGPAIHEVVHSPVLPTAGQAVAVTARVSDPDGMGAVTLRYRVDPSAVLQSVPMVDNGTGADLRAGDGIFTARIPGQSSGTVIAFHVEARDAAAVQATTKFPNDAPTRECLVRFGETQPPGNFGTYRLWMTRAVYDEWTNRDKLDNTPLDITFVYGNQRAIYNVDALFAGSPYISPGYSSPNGTLCGYTIDFPKDDVFLGETGVVLDWPGRDNSAVEEHMAFWMAEQIDLPVSYRRYIHLHVNGVNEQQRGSIYEDVQQPGKDMIEEWVPDYPDGHFYKIERWFEFNDVGGVILGTQPTLENFTTTGGAKKLARYRWNWLKRAYDDPNNYTNIFHLVDAVNSTRPEPYTSRVETLVDIDQWMGIFAVEHIVNNFDSYGHNIGKNMYAYKPDGSRWMLFMFDIDWVMRSSAALGYNPNSGLFEAEDPKIIQMYNHPPFRRAYFRAVDAVVNGPLVLANINAVMDEKYAALVANGVTRSAGQSLSSPAPVKTWLSQRRSFLVRQLATVEAPFEITTSGGSDFSTETNVVSLTGTAPVRVKDIRLNGVVLPTTWTTVTNWSAQVSLKAGVNLLALQGYDRTGTVLAESSDQVQVTFTGTPPPVPNILINEWMAANTKGIKNPANGNFDDWFELYNAGNETVNLAGYTMTDDLARPTKFVIPAGKSVSAGGFLLVWADEVAEANSTDTALHVNFKLSQGGEAIGLFAPDGRVVDTVSFGQQTPDVSQGRWPDGAAGSFQFLDSPTPGGANKGSEITPRFQDISVTPGTGATLTWSAQSGKRYQVQYKNSLDDTAWSNLGGIITASGNSASASDSSSIESSQRYFRIVLVE